MQNSEKDLELEGQNPDQQEQELELEEETETEGETKVEETSSDSDPLDTIEDVEELRKEAKKLRAIANRKKEKKEETPKKVNESDFLKKSDFQLANQRKAIKLATAVSDLDTEEIKQRKQEVLNNWEEVRKFYTPRRGKDTPEDILEDIKDAYVVFNNRKPKVDENDTRKELTETKIDKSSGGNPPQSKPPVKNPPNFKLPKQPDEWY